ncbi:hypothetical protein [Leptospira noguchii]|uniref:Uncharacterized protein n=1 Tax=Leptospira noguchii TaxID=28182 RepID=M6VE37_9LEPT|nr:hypothetical protein [Leptospira noguchii]EMO55120.1 hypothetical protein LEP1GSC172_1623 [Leptospira noguchii]UOG50974.1 hypothetical protein MAL00_20015 [Leptospira noguchii]
MVRNNQMRSKDLKQTDEEIDKAILEGIHAVNESELNHSEVYDPYVVLNGLESASKLMTEFNQHGLSPEDLLKRIRRTTG